MIINEDKTKYMIMTRRLINKQNLNIGQYTFEQLDNFIYLGVNINANNNMQNEINLRLAAANRSYFAMNKMFKSRLLSKESKVKLYTTYLRPVIMYGCEKWSTIKGDKGKLLRFERKILRRIYDPIRNPDNGEYEHRKNTDIEKLFNKPNIQSFLISKRLEWAAHVWRAKQDLINKVLTNNPSEKRPRGRPRQRWMDRIKNDLNRTARTVVMEEADNRNHWRSMLYRLMESFKNFAQNANE
ncbi:hypothetical protein QTP88_028238 [Uroleucon formosanum]